MIAAWAPGQSRSAGHRTARPVVLTSLQFACGGPADERPAATCACRWKSMIGASKADLPPRRPAPKP